MEGQLFPTGRIKDIIIIRGNNHYPSDIELTVERSHPALRTGCGAAFAVDVDGVEHLVVAQEFALEAQDEINADEVRGAIRRAIAQEHNILVYKILLLKRATIPKTSSGKIMRQACRMNYMSGNFDLIDTE